MLYVALLLSFVAVFGRLDDLRSLLFLGSVVCLVFPALLLLGNDDVLATET